MIVSYDIVTYDTMQYCIKWYDTILYQTPILNKGVFEPNNIRYWIVLFVLNC